MTCYRAWAGYGPPAAKKRQGWIAPPARPQHSAGERMTSSRFEMVYAWASTSIYKCACVMWCDAAGGGVGVGYTKMEPQPPKSDTRLLIASLIARQCSCSHRPVRFRSGYPQGISSASQWLFVCSIRSAFEIVKKRWWARLNQCQSPVILTVDIVIWDTCFKRVF